MQPSHHNHHYDLVLVC